MNAAGYFKPVSFLDHSPADYAAQMDINQAFFFITQAVAKNMQLHGGGAIVNTSSTSGAVATVTSADYTASSGKTVDAKDIDLLVRALSMGQLHHAMMGTAAVAIGTAAAIPGTLVNLAAGGGVRSSVRFGHPSGTQRVGAEAAQVNGQWKVTKALMSRSARILMEGWVRVPGGIF